MGEGVEGGFDGRARQDLLRRSRASGSAISSVSSNTSPSGKDGRISASDVASSRPASIASMSSWLLDTAGASAGAAAGGAGLTGGGAAFAAATCAAGMADGGMSFITSALTAGAAAAGFAGVAGLESFSAAAGFASSSAMIRRIDAKISSIEGSWTFAACVISDSTSSTPSYAFYTKRDWICRFRMCGPGFSSHKPDLSPAQAPLDTSRGIPPLLRAPKRRGQGCQHGANRSAAPRKGTSWQQLIASNALRTPSVFSRKRRWSGDQRPSGVRTPNQLSRPC